MGRTRAQAVPLLHQQRHHWPASDGKVLEVVFDYQETNVSDNVTYTAFGTDAYPLGSEGFAENASNMPIDLQAAPRATPRPASSPARILMRPPKTSRTAKKPDLDNDDIKATSPSATPPSLIPLAGILDTDTYAYEFKTGVAAP